MPTSELHVRRYATAAGGNAVVLPVDLDALVEGWQGVRRRMARHVAAGFERDEWAYLLEFLAPESLHQHFERAFGAASEELAPDATRAVFVPRSPIATWLPNNVSLLGPLTLVLVTLTGSDQVLKAGSDADDLAQAFLVFAQEHAGTEALRELLERIQVVRADRGDSRLTAISRSAAARIVFGSDEGVAAVSALPHKAGSITIGFGDHASEAWVSGEAATDDVLRQLVRIFAIYGQAGCTSPRRLVALDHDEKQAAALARRLAALWPDVVRRRVAMHVASANLAAAQLGAMRGWSPVLAPDNAAVVMSGGPELEPVEGPQALSVVGALLPEAITSAPPNLQTIGYATDALDWPAVVAATGALRVVPLAEMHHFGSVWDGRSFWRELFVQTELRA